jgi:hypothetical protein
MNNPSSANQPTLPNNDNINQNDDRIREEAVTPASFVPSFLCPMKDLESLQVVDTNEAIHCANDIASLVNGSHAQSPPQMASPPISKKRKTGALFTRLQKIRNDILGDTIRFQSGQYPFREKKSLFDLNDPRSRARSSMDLTILSDAEQFDHVQGTGKQLVALCYLHEHLVSVDGTESAIYPRAVPVWSVFHGESVRTLNLRRGSAVRIYDGIPVAMADPCQWIIICSELIELYPAILGDLTPSPSELLSHLAGGNAENE